MELLWWQEIVESSLPETIHPRVSGYFPLSVLLLLKKFLPSISLMFYDYDGCVVICCASCTWCVFRLYTCHARSLLYFACSITFRFCHVTTTCPYDTFTIFNGHKYVSLCILGPLMTIHPTASSSSLVLRLRFHLFITHHRSACLG